MLGHQRPLHIAKNSNNYLVIFQIILQNYWHNDSNFTGQMA